VAKVVFDHTSYVETTRRRDPEDSWDRGNTYTEHHLSGTFQVAREDEYYHLEIPFTPVEGEYYY
jgi:hypothetical protein